MKRYAFRLQPVLNVRRLQEDLAKAALATANQQVVQADQVVESRLHRYRSISPMTGMCSTAAFLGQRSLHELAADAVLAANAARADAVREAQARREAWSETAKVVSILERLDERRRAEHAVEAARQEELEIDDIVVGRHGRATAR